MARTSKRYLEKTADAEKTTISIEKYFVGIYSRLSVDIGDKKSESIENQIEVIRQYIADQNTNPVMPSITVLLKPTSFCTSYSVLNAS